MVVESGPGSHKCDMVTKLTYFDLSERDSICEKSGGRRKCLGRSLRQRMWQNPNATLTVALSSRFHVVSHWGQCKLHEVKVT